VYATAQPESTSVTLACACLAHLFANAADNRVRDDARRSFPMLVPMTEFSGG
jgi:hypothetical protein